MRVECIKEKLRAAIVSAERATGKNLALPVLSSILLEAREKSLRVRATNLEIGVEINIPAKVLEAGTIAVSGALLNNFLGLVADGDVLKLEAVKGNLTVATRATNSIVKGVPADDFPTIPRVNGAGSFSLSSEHLVAGLKATVYSAALSDMKPEISSVHCYVDENEIVFVATDSFRLAEKRFSIGKDTRLSEDNEPLSIIIPYRNVLEIIRLFESVVGKVAVQYSKHQISLTSEDEGVYVTSRLVSGLFPNYQQILVKEKTTEIVVAKQQLLSALKLTNIFADKLNQVTFKVIPGDGLCEVSSQSGDVGESASRLEATVEGEDITIGFNNRYILDCFSSIEEEMLSLALNGPNRPLTIRGMGDPTFFYLVMPLQR
ncbi:MAG: DNA polymerase III subunit beta [Candidatus Vogelbacteria bacterium CG10_big_fil_rev_8_21_14_0_10_51_16]|uniref:Beta sliding clamp n=1 Tax=Candidatus Vogelbacteria bacterium CG10_big_fil_rev_8_21_14_0_10_51_16 TaxID=1975045 RepID=A0A2H0RDJ9_9BACT|nr:MAG: DNA polymerase III subunit beta [Candidatus Vogelbacteria bacterium CG10_big_fil_rev_8_21_14_0_10_51_16]